MGLRILVDENDDGMAGWLRSKGYDVESVRELKKEDELMGHDYNVIKRAHEKDMILITRDAAVISACRANGIKCISVEEDVIRRYVLDEIVKLKGGAQ